MSKLKGITLVWLSKTDLSNLNAGEGGGGNVTELKTYDNGRKPYASGQSVRHAIRQAVERLNPNVFRCTPESPCGKVAECWLCDIFGYLNPKLGEGFDRRWSPLKVTPALGQIASEIVTDLLIRMSEREKAEDERRDQRIAYVQMMANVYRLGLSIDVANIGKVVKPLYEKQEMEITEEDTPASPDDKKTKKRRKKSVEIFKGWETPVALDVEERRKRALAVLEAVGGLADFAKQARNATSLAPDVLLAATHPRYTHRTLRTLALDDEGNVNERELRVVLQDLQDDEAQLFFGFTPNVVKNEDTLLAIAKEFKLESLNPARALRNLIEAVKKAEIE
jgi:CRISPR-associated protein Cst2